MAVQNLRSLEIAEQRAREAQQRSDELAQINRVVSSVATSLNLNEALNIAIREIAEALPGIGRAGLALLDESRQSLIVESEYIRDPERTESALGLKISIADNILTQEVIRTRKPVILENAQNNAEIPVSLRKEFKRLGVQSMVIFPVIASNVIVGTLG